MADGVIKAILSNLLSSLKKELFDMARADFTHVEFNHHFSAVAPEETRSLTIEGIPHGGYILVQVADVENFAAQIEINGVDLPGWDVPPGLSNKWSLWTDPIPTGFLKEGDNRLTIRSGGGDFFVRSVWVHWREAN